MIELREYIDAQGNNQYRKWASKQDPSVRARVDKAVFRLAEGNFSSVKPEARESQHCGSISVRDTVFISPGTENSL
jgi:hypothetical protein